MAKKGPETKVRQQSGFVFICGQGPRGKVPNVVKKIFRGSVGYGL
jgi:hypothetical protein